MEKELKISMECEVALGACRANANNTVLGCCGRNWC